MISNLNRKSKKVPVIFIDNIENGFTSLDSSNKDIC